MKFVLSKEATPLLLVLASSPAIVIAEPEAVVSIPSPAEIVKVPDNGQVVFKIEKLIAASKRGLLLLKLEEILKSKIDKGITVWCEPVGDKSVLRKLRGVTIDS